MRKILKIHFFPLIVILSILLSCFFICINVQATQISNSQYTEFGTGEWRELLKGKKVSVLGDSISTLNGVSNNPTYRDDIANNYVYYRSEPFEFPYWSQVINKYGMELCVNNSWSGSLLSSDNVGNGIKNSGIYRADKLTHKNGTKPDIIIVFIGINDLNAGIDSSVVGNAYKTMFEKMKDTYPNAHVFSISMPNRTIGDAAAQAYNAVLKAALSNAGSNFHYVDLYNSALCDELYNTYSYNDNLHPNYRGMNYFAMVLGNEIAKVCANHTHQEYTIPATPSTCAKSGSSEQIVCTDCKMILLPKVELAKEKHQVELKNAVDPTHSKNGYMGDLICTKCDDEIYLGNVIPAIGSNDPKNTTEIAYWDFSKDLNTLAKNNLLTVVSGNADINNGKLVPSNAILKMQTPISLKYNENWGIEWSVDSLVAGQMILNGAAQDYSTNGNGFIWVDKHNRLCIGTKVVDNPATSNIVDAGLISFGKFAVSHPEEPHTFAIRNAYNKYTKKSTISFWIDDKCVIEDISNQVGFNHQVAFGPENAKKVLKAISLDKMNFTFGYIGSNDEFLMNQPLNYLRITVSDTPYSANSETSSDDEPSSNIIVPSDHTHTIKHVAKKAPTCTEDGNIEYWTCTQCNMIFGDAKGQTQATEVVLYKTGHKLGGTVTETNEDGKKIKVIKCKVCGKTLNDKEVDAISSITKNYNDEDSAYLLWVLYTIIALLCLSIIAITLILVLRKLRKVKADVIFENDKNLNEEYNQDIESE